MRAPSPRTDEKPPLDSLTSRPPSPGRDSFGARNAIEQQREHGFVGAQDWENLFSHDVKGTHTWFPRNACRPTGRMRRDRLAPRRLKARSARARIVSSTG